MEGMMPIIPKVTKEMTAAFGKAWDSNGVKIILDATTIQFATDWANIALKSFVEDINAQAVKLREEKKAALAAGKPAEPTNAVATQTVVPKPSGIILTD
jgi:hypothetical protein